MYSFPLVALGRRSMSTACGLTLAILFMDWLAPAICVLAAFAIGGVFCSHTMVLMPMAILDRP
jgi:hypothetical protein